MAQMKAYDDLARFIKDSRRLLVTTHINPDGDGVGSMCALYQALTRMGKDVILYDQDGMPDSLAFLPASDQVLAQIPTEEPFDAAIMVDCSEPRRAGDAFARASKGLAVGVIDHHLYSNIAGMVACLDESAASAGEVVWRLLKRMGATLNRDIALCIYTTLVVDTGFFRYSNTTGDVLSLAAELVSAGAEPWLVARNLDESYTEGRLHLLGAALSTVIVSDDGRYATMDVTQRMMRETGTALIDSDEFAPYPRTIKSVEVAALFRELADGTTKVSMRSKDHVNVAEIARRYGGGGHIRAAGFSLKCSLAEAKKLVKEEVKKTLMSF